MWYVREFIRSPFRAELDLKRIRYCALTNQVRRDYMDDHRIQIPDHHDAHTSTHGCAADTVHDIETPEIDLLSPLTIRTIQFRNRIVMSPMCQYSSREGLANDWRLVHLVSRAAGGAALAIVEATAVTRYGRITS